MQVKKGHPSRVSDPSAITTSPQQTHFSIRFFANHSKAMDQPSLSFLSPSPNKFPHLQPFISHHNIRPERFPHPLNQASHSTDRVS